VKSRASGDR